MPGIEPDNQPTKAAMTTSSEPVAPESTEVELDLGPLVETLTARTPGADPAQVRQVVENIAHRFDGARVRDFLPVLILKAAKDQLRSLGLARPVAV